MQICEEMKKLRKWLDENNIEWKDRSTDSGLLVGGVEFWICRTHFWYHEFYVSAINGFGSYGGFGAFNKTNEGLLEIMIDDGDPIGYLTSEEVVKELRKVCGQA